ncbi:mevalonate kinase [Legionella sp. W05-934-2]|jgi:mevalonate kinase|uniref:mevalonate kinase family protein n=1 Tax=Legionella sp. W05-934-2 TaxID=1198649 RepID=UPI0034634301
MSSDFSTTVTAKWILAGEHSVVRSHPAIIYPLPHYQLSLSYEKSSSPWEVNVSGIHHQEIETLFFSTLEHALTLANRQPINKTGKFSIHNAIPIGSGLGASAAFCLAISRWLAWQHDIDPSELYFQAKQLENLFHGQSSGIDIVGVGASQGRIFHAGHHEAVTQTWQPHWYLSSSGSLSKTSKCIEEVKAIWQNDPSLAHRIDEQMTESVLLAKEALQTANGITKLAEAINLAQNCFQQWGLIDTHLQCHLDNLTTAGALACKPTGSGGGGYVISLWEQSAPQLPWTMIPLQQPTLRFDTKPTKDFLYYD